MKWKSSSHEEEGVKKIALRSQPALRCSQNLAVQTPLDRLVGTVQEDWFSSHEEELAWTGTPNQEISLLVGCQYFSFKIFFMFSYYIQMVKLCAVSNFGIQKKLFELTFWERKTFVKLFDRYIAWINVIRPAFYVRCPTSSSVLCPSLYIIHHKSYVLYILYPMSFLSYVICPLVGLVIVLLKKRPTFLFRSFSDFPFTNLAYNGKASQ